MRAKPSACAEIYKSFPRMRGGDPLSVYDEIIRVDLIRVVVYNNIVEGK